MILDLSSIIPAVAFVPYVLFLLFGLYRKRGERFHMPFILYMSLMAVWSFGSFMMHANTGIADATFWNRFMLVGMLGVPIAIFFSVLDLIGTFRRRYISVLVIGVSIYGFLQYLNFRGLIVSEAGFENGEFYYRIAGGALAAYSLCYAFLMVGILHLTRELVSSKNHQLKRQLRIPLYGTILMITGVLVNLYELLGRYPVDLFASTINAFGIFYVIYRYKLIHYSQLVMKVILYFVLITISVLVFTVIIWVTFASVRNIPLRYSVLPSLMLGLVSAVIFQPLRIGTQLILERVYFGKRLSYYGSLKNFMELSASIVDLEKLGALTIEKISETFDVEWSCIIVIDYGSRNYKIISQRNLEIGSLMNANLAYGKDSFMNRLAPRDEGVITVLPADETVRFGSGAELAELHPSLLLFLKFKKRLNGVILLGKRRERDDWDQFDLEVLELLAHQCAVALENTISFERLRRQQKRLQTMNQELALSRNKLQAFFDGITTPISIQDVNHNIIAANVAATHYFGKSFKDLIGAKCYQAFFGLQKPCEGCMAQDCCHAQIPFGVELSDPESQTVFDVQFYPITVLDGQSKMFLEFFKDITQQLRLQEELQRSEKLATIGSITTGIVRDINDPLHRIIRAVELSLEGDRTGPDVRERMTEILRHAEDAADVIHELSSYSAKDREKKTETEIPEILEASLKLALHGVESAGIAVFREYGEVPAVEADPDDIQQVLLHLIVSAIRELRGRGTLTVSCTRKDWIAIVRITKTAELQTEGCERDAPAAPSARFAEKSARFELNICQQIIFRLGGRIDAEPRSETQTELTISLPIALADRERIRYVHAKHPREIDDVFYLQRKILVGEKGYREETIRREEDERAYHIVAYRGLQPVGTVTCSIQDPGSRPLPIENSFRLERFKNDAVCAEIDRLAVLKEERGSLIPLGLMTMAYVYIKAHRAERIFLDVFSDEKKLIKMYGKLGFTYIGAYVSPLPVTVMYLDRQTDYEKKASRMERFVRPFLSRLTPKLDLDSTEREVFVGTMNRIAVGAGVEETEEVPVV